MFLGVVCLLFVAAFVGCCGVLVVANVVCCLRCVGVRCRCLLSLLVVCDWLLFAVLADVVYAAECGVLFAVGVAVAVFVLLSFVVVAEVCWCSVLILLLVVVRCCLLCVGYCGCCCLCVVFGCCVWYIVCYGCSLLLFIVVLCVLLFVWDAVV